ncbi:hypothetical protein E2C01_013184 [Portunus trituberculatus]|uniref:Uncharacterized protein n=1 Tax=Portunus trituberculatus TaxID=210409 RepID=A0A5B7DFY8_PORTR|nr:hypothetical protein [Portunus trituberculatus]
MPVRKQVMKFGVGDVMKRRVYGENVQDSDGSGDGGVGDAVQDIAIGLGWVVRGRRVGDCSIWPHSENLCHSTLDPLIHHSCTLTTRPLCIAVLCTSSAKVNNSFTRCWKGTGKAIKCWMVRASRCGLPSRDPCCRETRDT